MEVEEIVLAYKAQSAQACLPPPGSPVMSPKIFLKNAYHAVFQAIDLKAAIHTMWGNRYGIVLP
jgi:hypothetical protein